MRLVIVLVVASLFGTVAVAADPPKRKSGLWHVVITAEGAPRMQFHECVDRDSDDLAKPEEGTTCSKLEVRRQGASYVVESVCKEDGSTATTRAVFTGNFEAAYNAESKTSFRPPMQGVAELTQKMEARWIGAACKPGQQPGDMQLFDTPASAPAPKGAQKKR
ncbi:MAG: DUF3617 domain-containing protein [Sphingomicrobium sp.]